MEKIEIQRFIRSIVRRAHTIQLLVSCNWMLFAGILGVLLASLGFSLHLHYQWVSIIFYSIVLFVAVYVLWRFVQHYVLWSSPLYPYDKVEAEEPMLRGRSYLALDEEDTEEPNFLRTRALQKVLRGLSDIAVERIVSMRPVWRTLHRLVVISIIAVFAQYTLPVGPLQAWAALQSQQAFLQESLQKIDITDESAIVIGDITIHYIFPEYTKMTPITIPNSNGEIHAPPGTKIHVQAKTLERYQAVQIQFNQDPAQEATLSNGREISAEFVLEKEGGYRFVLFDGTQRLPSQAFDMVFDDDDPPVVSVEMKQTKIPSNRPVAFKWTATDDFGLERVVLEIEKKGQVSSFVLRRPENNQLELSANMKRAVSELGLQGGDTAILRVVAYDNQAPIDREESVADGEAFGKRGASADIEIMIMTPEMTAEEMRDLNRKLRDTMLFILADYLVETTPKFDALGMWGDTARLRYDPLRELTNAEWGEQWPTYLSAQLVADVLADSASIMRFLMTTFGPSKIGQPKQADYTSFTEMYESHIAQLERTIYIIDTMLRQVAFMEVAKNAASLNKEVEKFTEMDLENMTAQELTMRLEPINRRMEKLLEATTDLGDGSIKEFIVQRQMEIQNLEKELQKSLEANNTEQIRDLSEQISKAMEQYNDGVQEHLQRLKDEEDQMQQEMESLIEKLEQMEKAEQELANELSTQRAEHDVDGQSKIEIWKKLETLAERSLEYSKEIVDKSGDGRGFQSSTIYGYERLLQQAQKDYNLVISKDSDTLLEEVYIMSRHIAGSNSRTSTELNRQRRPQDALPPSVSSIPNTLNELSVITVEMQELLSKAEMQESSNNEYMSELAQQQNARQKNLRIQMQQAVQEVIKLEQQMPTADGSASEFAKEAVEDMQEAGDSLQQGDSLRGEGFEIQSALRIRDTIDALQQQMQQMQQMQQQMQQMSGESSGSDDGDSQDVSSVDIPPIERRLTPEEYRKQLLEGMQGDVPQEFEILKKRYYEELVAQ